MRPDRSHSLERFEGTGFVPEGTVNKCHCRGVVPMFGDERFGFVPPTGQDIEMRQVRGSRLSSTTEATKIPGVGFLH